ncbi:DNA polymerase III subunit beta [candidate division KSB1 bacterium]|nr:DNA polymerase III subunit beta [candidate division KSB1 bacterium]
MHFTVSKSVFYKSLQKVIGVIPTKTTIPILENIMIELKDNTLQLTGTDLEICISTELKVNGMENGACTVPAKSFNEILRELPDVPIEISLEEDDKFHIKTDKGLYKLVSQPKDEFPSIVVEDSEGQLDINAQILYNMIDKTIFAVSTDELRPTLMGVFFQITSDEFRCVSTDGHRLVKVINRDFKSSEFQKSVIVPTKALSLLLKNLDTFPNIEKVQVNFSIGENHVIFRIGEAFVYSKIIEGQYPKFENVIPINNDKKMIVNREELMSSVKRVSIFSNLITHQIKFLIDENNLTISSEDIEFGGEGNEEIPINYESERMEIGYNGVYVLDILRHLDTDDVEFLLKDSVSAAIINPSAQKQNEDLMMLIMPIRIKEE